MSMRRATITARSRATTRGFTLVELMFVVGIIGIMSTLAVGLTTDFRRRSTFDTVAREVYNSLNTARARAIKRGNTVHVGFAQAPNAVRVFEDANANDAFDDGTDKLVYKFPKSASDWPSGSADITAVLDPFVLAANGGTQIMIFDQYGFHVGTDGEPLGCNGPGCTIALTDTTNGKKKYVDVTVAGALRIR